MAHGARWELIRSRSLEQMAKTHELTIPSGLRRSHVTGRSDGGYPAINGMPSQGLLVPRSVIHGTGERLPLIPADHERYVASILKPSGSITKQLK